MGSDRKLIIATVIVAVLLVAVSFFQLGIFGVKSLSVTILDREQYISFATLDTGQEWGVVEDGTGMNTIRLESIRDHYGEDAVDKCKSVARERQFSLIGMNGGNSGGDSIAFQVFSLETEQYIPCNLIVNGNTIPSDGNDHVPITETGTYTIQVTADGYAPTEQETLTFTSIGRVNIYCYMKEIPQPNEYTLTTSVSPEGAGVVWVTPEQDTYEAGTEVTVYATANEGWVFDHWQISIAAVPPPDAYTTVVMNENKTVTAYFVRQVTPQYTLYLNSADNPIPEGIHIYVDPPGYTYSSYSSHAEISYDENTVVNFDITADAGYQFTYWSDGDTNHYDSTFSITMDSDKVVTVYGERITQDFVLRTNVIPGGSGMIAPAGGTYTEGTEVTLTATPYSGYIFNCWGGDIGAGNQNPVTITMNSDMTVNAYFTAIPSQYTLTTNVVGSGTVSPSGGTYDEGTTLVLTATPSSGWTFDHWGGDASGSSPSVTITMSGDKSVTAYFVEIQPDQFTLTLASDPPEGGTITATPSGGTYDAGTTVTLTAVPNNGYAFKGWTGTGITDTTSLTTTVTINSDMTVTAHFEKTTAHMWWLLPLIVIIVISGAGAAYYIKKKH